MENELIEMFNNGNDNYYGKGKKVKYLFEDDEFNNDENYDEEFIDGWEDLKNRLKEGKIIIEDDDIVYNFELKKEDILMWFIEI